MTSLLHRETREGITEHPPKRRVLKRDAAAGRYWTTKLVWTRERCSPTSKETVEHSAKTGPLDEVLDVISVQTISKRQLIFSAFVIGAILTSAIYIACSYLI